VTVSARTRTPATPNLTVEDVEALSKLNNEPQWLLERRLAAWETYLALPMPTTKDEAWRRTDFRRIKWAQAGQLLQPDGQASLDTIPDHTYSPVMGEQQAGLVAHVDSTVAANQLLDDLKAQGVVFCDLHTAVREYPELVQKALLSGVVPPEDGKFAALHNALWTHGVFLYVPAGKTITLPFHSVFFNVASGLTLGRIVAVIDDGADVTYMHEYASTPQDGQSAFVGATELVVGQGARLRYVALQHWGTNVYEFSHQRARVQRDGYLDWVVGTMGGKLVKNFMELDLDGQGSTGRMSGLYFADGSQLMDHDTQQNHNAPNTTSDLLFKGALVDKARSVWQGMIYVDPVAQKTDGFQANRNLLLSRNARADSIPGLEILADDVRCTHAATISKLDEEPIFYLMSRGLPRREAEKLAVDGFFQPIMDRIPFETVRERLKASIERKHLGADAE